MSVRAIQHAYDLAAARGHISEEQVAKATAMTVLEAGMAAFHRAYYGDKAWAEAVQDARKARHESNEAAMGIVHLVLEETSRLQRVMKETHTTTDFPLALAMVRDRVRRGSYNPVESSIWDVATRRTAANFKPLRGIRTDAFDRLKLRPEGTNVQYASFGSDEDAYRVASYELAIAYTWEAYTNDDIDEFTTALANLGVAARRNRALVVFEAIRDGLTRTTPSGTTPEGSAGAGGPTPANIAWAYQQFAEQTNASGKPMPRMLTDVRVPAVWGITGRQTLESQFVVSGNTTARLQQNAAAGLAQLNIEPMMAEVMGEGSGNVADWVASDDTQSWLELATLRGFEGGPRTFTKAPDVVETLDLGSFDNHSFAVKVSDAVGAKVVDDKSAILVAGA